MTKRPLPGSPHDALSRLLDEIGRESGPNGSPSEGIAVAADFLGISHWTLRSQLDPDRVGSEVAYSRVAQLTQHFGCTDAAEHLALCAGGVFLPMPQGSGRINELSAGAMLEMSEALVALAKRTAPTSEAGADLSWREATEALPLIADAMAMLSTLYSEVRAKAGAQKGRG